MDNHPRQVRRQWAQNGALAVALLTLVGSAGCVDLRDYEGQWSGAVAQVEAPLRVGFDAAASLTLEIERADLGTLAGHLTTSDGRFSGAEISPIPGSLADATAELTFTGSPTRVYLAFVSPTDGAGDALAVIALFADDRVTIRLARAGPQPLYGIFTLRQKPRR